MGRWVGLGEAESVTAAAREEARSLARPLESEADLDPLLDRVAEARLVLLGEASHGTREYYEWRARISLRLLRDHGFQFIAVEGDWPDCYALNRYVKGLPGAAPSAWDALQAFTRWPTWMWANREVLALMEELRGLNTDRDPEDRVGFYGLDVYSLWDSLAEVSRYLEEHQPGALQVAREAFRCFEPYHGDEQAYARATTVVPMDCSEEVTGMLTALLRSRRGLEEDEDARFDAEQNAWAAANAERYYRAMMQGGPDSWNLRDTHMMDTLDRLLERHGPDAKAIVWAHNTHVGDARATDMQGAGMTNLGQLARERHGLKDTVIVGFAGYRGHVIAGAWWGAPMHRMFVPEAPTATLEGLLHETGPRNQLLLFDPESLDREALLRGAPLEQETLEGLAAPLGHRAIGVVYDPEHERYGNYVPTSAPLRYDALLFFDRTRALRPLAMPVEAEEVPETYPYGE